MSWLGIPFLFTDAVSKNDTVIEISKLPSILLKSDFSWEGIIGSLIAGCIPAYIAWKTIKSNSDVMHRQIVLSAQQRKIDELKELCANYIAIRSNTIDYTDVIYGQYDGDRTKIPTEIVTELKADYLKMDRCINLILLTVGNSDEFSVQLRNEIKRMDKTVHNYFDNYNEIETFIDEFLETDNELLMGIFSKILEREEAKIYS